MAKVTRDKTVKALEKLVGIKDPKVERTLAALKEGKRKIKKNWLQGEWAIDENGDEVKATSEKAVGWCALGAVGLNTDEKLNPAGRALTVALEPGWTSVFEFNDDGAETAQDVVKVFDRAIKHVEEHGVPTTADVRKALNRPDPRFEDDDA